MKTTIIKSLAVVAVFSFTLFGCTTTSEETLNESVTAVVPVSDAQLLSEEAEFMTQFEDQSRSGGVAASAYRNMFSDIENTANYNFFSLTEKDSNLSTFSELLDLANMKTAIEDYTGRSFTIFAPTNAAFEALPAGLLEELREPEHRAKLVRLLQAHMVATPLPASKFTDNQQIQFGNDMYIPIKVTNPGNVTVGGANIVKPNVQASNGVIHVVDAVVQPVGTYDVTE